MKQRYQVIPRTLCFVFYQNQLLLLKGGKSKPWAGKYNCLGGHIEKGEDVLESAIREIKEESGLHLPNTKLLGVFHIQNYFGKNILMFVTSSTTDTKQVVSNHEGELVWVDTESINKLNTFADIKQFLTHILDHPHQFFTATSKFDDQGSLLRLRIKS